MFGVKFGRNDPCWCGSGRKYKKCHLGKENKPAISPWDAEKQLRKSFSASYCSVPKALAPSCKGQIVRAHTVPKSGSLKRISLNGHVLCPDSSFKTLSSTNGNLLFKEKGINQASTFTGFCAYHDVELFKSVELDNFSGTAEQCFTLAYRAIAREHFTKSSASKHLINRFDFDDGKSSAQQFSIQELLRYHAYGTDLGLREISRIKSQYEICLVQKAYADVRSLIVSLSSPPPVMCSAAFFPEQDLSGAKLQDLADASKVLASITVTAFHGGVNGHYVFTWLASEHEKVMLFMKSLCELDDHSLVRAINHLLFCQFENVHISPGWWTGLSDQEKEFFRLRMQTIANPFHTLPDGYLGQFPETSVGVAVIDRSTLGFSI